MEGWRFPRRGERLGVWRRGGRLEVPTERGKVGHVEERGKGDVSLRDVASVLIASQTIEGAERFPVPFAIRYDPAEIDERRDYSVQVSIRVGGELVYANDTVFSALTRGYPSDNLAVEVVRIR